MGRTLLEEIKSVVAEVLEIEEDDITEETKLVGDLEAESLDLLDILFKLSKSQGKKVTMQTIQQDVRGGLTEEQFISETGYITEEGIEKIKQAFANPNLEFENCTSKDVLGLIDIHYIEKIFSIQENESTL